MDDNESIALEESGNLGEIEIKLKSNGVCHVEDGNDKLQEDIKIGAQITIPPSETVMSPEGMGSSSPAVRLRKWKRVPRELVKNPGSNIDGRNNGDLSDSLVNGSCNVLHDDSGLGYEPVLAPNSEEASATRTRPKISNSNGGNSAISDHSGDQKSNGQSGTKKARGFKIEKENSDSNMANFVFVQGFNSSKSREIGNSANDHDHDHDDDEDKLLNKEPESKDVTQEDVLLESITRFDSAVEQLEREVQKWKEIGKDVDDSINDILELKDSMIMELESTITSEDTKTEIDHLLKEKIQAEVEIEAITTTTKSLITGPLNEMKLNLQEKDTNTKEEDVKNVENKLLKKQETNEDVKKLQNRVCRLSSCLMIQLILLFVTFYFEICCDNVGLVPT